MTDPEGRCRCSDAIYARELTHRMGNTLQAALAAIELARRGRTAHLHEAGLQLEGAVALQRLLGDTSLGLLDLAPHLHVCCRAALDAAGGGPGIQLHSDPASLIADARYARPLLMLAAELIANCVRHAFPEGTGRIEVELLDDGLHTSLIVEDDGRCEGSWRPDGQGFGIIDSLAGSIGGRIERSLTPGGSSRVGVHVPSIAAAAGPSAGAA